MILQHPFFTPLFTFVALLQIICGVQGSMHRYDPFEIDVNSEEIVVKSASCEYNSEKGFAGDIGTNFFTVEYYYAIQVNASLLHDTEVAYKEPTSFEDLPKGSLQNLVFEVELAVAAHLLHESSTFDSAPCNHGMRGLVEDPSSKSGLRMDRDRRMSNVGLAIGPDEELLGMCEIQTEGQPCYEYAGRFQIYTVGVDDNTIEVKDEIKIAIKVAMDAGEFDDAHPALLGVYYLDAIPLHTVDEVQTEEEDTVQGTTPTIQNGPSAAVIIGASLGVVLSIATVALVRRRRYSRGIEAALEFQMSRDDAGAEKSMA